MHKPPTTTTGGTTMRYVFTNGRLCGCGCERPWESLSYASRATARAALARFLAVHGANVDPSDYTITTTH